MIFLTVGVVVPLSPLLIWSVSGGWHYPDLLPGQYSTRAWRYIFDTASMQLLDGLTASASIAIAASLLSLLLGVPAGRALGLYDFFGKKLAIILLTLPIIVPPLSIAMGLHLWFIRLGLAETYVGVVLVHLTFCLPYTVFVMWGVFKDYDLDIEEQARTLGASKAKIISTVMLPMTFPGITVAALFAFLLSWSQYLSTLIIGGGKMLTLPILLFSLMDSGDRPVAAAVSLVFILPAFVALLFSAHGLGRAGMRGVR
jgi:putative spermidine/putrescine transport system permease protein